MSQPFFTIVPRTPWRIAARRSRPSVYRSATPLLCLPGATVRQEGREVWSFDWLGSGASDDCLPGHEPDKLRQIAAMVALIQATSSAARVSLATLDNALAEIFAATYPFAIDRLFTGDDHDSIQRHRRDLRGAAA